MKTIRQQLTRNLLGGMSLLMAVGAGVVYWTTSAALTRQFDDKLLTKTIALTSIIEQEGDKITVDSSDLLMREFDQNRSDAFFQISHVDGSGVQCSPSLQGTLLPLKKSSFEHPVFWNMTLANGLPVRVAGMKFFLHPSGEKIELSIPLEALLMVALDRRPLDQAQATLALVLTASGLFVVALTALLVPWLLRRELAPLDHLAAQAEQMTAQSLNERFSIEDLPGELAPISVRLNDLLERLQVAFVQERQFSDDLAHEFRTPIAELRSLVELSLKWPDLRNPETDRHVLAITLQMEAMINRLLLIARSERGLGNKQVEPMDLTSLVLTVSQTLQERAVVRQLSFQINFPSSLEIESDLTLVRSIVNNLVENAVEYSRSGSVIQMKGEIQNDHFNFRITNRVEQLTPEDVPYLFERFWRKDDARTSGEHSGLGLSLSRALAISLGYTLEASLNSEGDLTLILTGLAKGGDFYSTISTTTEEKENNPTQKEKQ